MRASLKRAVEALLVRGGAVGVARQRRRRRPAILAYHNVVPDETPPQGDRSLHVPLSRFRRQLDLLCETHDVVPLDSLRESGAISTERPVAAITFDDAYRGAVTTAVAELVERGIPGTIFVAPGLLGDRSFWWDDLANDASGLSDSLRRKALEELGGRETAVRDWARGRGQRELPLADVYRSALETELREAAEQPRISLGAHSWSHPNLANLEPSQLADELRRPLQWLRERFATTIDWLAYPYGLSSPDVENAALATGYVAAVRNVGGLVPVDAVEFSRLPRINVPAGLTDNGFLLRCAGLRV